MIQEAFQPRQRTSLADRIGFKMIDLGLGIKFQFEPAQMVHELSRLFSGAKHTIDMTVGEARDGILDNPAVTASLEQNLKTNPDLRVRVLCNKSIQDDNALLELQQKHSTRFQITTVPKVPQPYYMIVDGRIARLEKSHQVSTLPPLEVRLFRHRDLVQEISYQFQDNWRTVAEWTKTKK